jgi:transcriptional antiterminator RfaH
MAITETNPNFYLGLICWERPHTAEPTRPPIAPTRRRPRPAHGRQPRPQATPRIRSDTISALQLPPTTRGTKSQRETEMGSPQKTRKSSHMTQDDPQLPWYIAQLRPNGLSMALRNLERQSVNVFAPTETRTERRGQKFVTREAPAFPGYVFVQPSHETGGMRAINSTRGINKLVSLGVKPAVVPRDLIAALRLRFAPSVELPPPEFSPGDRVQILSGPLSDLIAQVEATAPQDRVYLPIELMGRATRAAVDARHLRGLKE